jgi:hypothetical protein
MQSLVIRKTLESISLDHRSEGEITQDGISDIKEAIREITNNPLINYLSVVVYSLFWAFHIDKIILIYCYLQTFDLSFLNVKVLL